MNFKSKNNYLPQQEKREALKKLLGEEYYNTLTEWQIMCEAASLDSWHENNKGLLGFGGIL